MSLRFLYSTILFSFLSFLFFLIFFTKTIRNGYNKFLCTGSCKRDLVAFAIPERGSDYFETSRFSWHTSGRTRNIKSKNLRILFATIRYRCVFFIHLQYISSYNTAMRPYNTITIISFINCRIRNTKLDILKLS